MLNHITKQLNSPKATEAFVFTLLTKKERANMARRLLIASLIQQGKTYFEINEKLDVSPNTFTKINKWLNEELLDYQSALDQTEATTQARKEKRSQFSKPRKKNIGAPISYQRMKHKHPAHFLLFTLAEELLKSKQ